MYHRILCVIITCVCYDLAPLATSSACSDFLHILDRASNLSILTLLAPWFKVIFGFHQIIKSTVKMTLESRVMLISNIETVTA